MTGVTQDIANKRDQFDTPHDRIVPRYDGGASAPPTWIIKNWGKTVRYHGTEEQVQDYIKNHARGATYYPANSRDPVNHPHHYNSHPSGVECITITRHMNFNLGNALKYIWRSSTKGQQLEDLRKAIWYLQDEIRRLESP